jgi:DNA-binding LacI/PurR family transcriptional regulator
MSIKTKKVGIIDIAKRAGVSPATVSRFLNNHPSTSPEVRNQLLQVMQELNYVPKVSVGDNRIAILIESIDNIELSSYENSLISAISRHAFNLNCDIEIVPCKHVKSVLKSFLKVALAIVYNEETERWLERECPIPFISINSQIKGHASVCSDHRGSIGLAVNHLVKTGHKRIAYLGHSVNSWGEMERQAGYQQALEANNMPCLQELLVTSSSVDIVENVAKLMLSAPDALIAASESFGTKVNYALYLLGKKVPDDISVISFENEQTSQYLIPPQTTIQQNFGGMAEEAVQLASKVLKGQKTVAVPKRLWGNTLIERNSVKDRT